MRSPTNSGKQATDAEEIAQLRAELEAARRQAEAHAELEGRYMALLEASSDLVWWSDEHGAVSGIAGWERITGQELDKSKGTGWLEMIHPDDRAATEKGWQRAYDEKSEYRHEYRLRMREGSYRWFRARAIPVARPDGSIREWVGTLEDIEDEKRQETERLEETRLLETLRDISTVLTSELNLETIVQRVTDSTTQLSGAQFGAFFYNVFDAGGEKLTLYTLSGAPRDAFENFGHPRPTPVFAPTFYGTHIVRSDDITKDERYGRMGPHHGMPPNHLPVTSYLAVPVIARNGEVLGGLFFGHAEPGVFTERTERLVAGVAASAAVAIDNARLYEAERNARSSAEAANEAKSAFLANMSHELRTPLNAIGGYADLIAAGIRGPVTEAQIADLNRIKRSQQHLLSIINDILNFAKLEAGRVRYALEDVSLAKALGELETLISPQLQEKRLSYEYICCDDRFTAHVDREKLQQVMLNLLSNASKFTAPGGSITVVCNADHDNMTVTVTDTGVGIPSDKLEAIFEPFVQVDRSQPAGNIGTGLGLAISRDLARGMGGDLLVQSTVGVGSTFTLILPRRAGGPQIADART